MVGELVLGIWELWQIFVCSICGYVYIFETNENTSLKVDFFATHHIIEAKAKTHIHKHLLQGNWTLTMKGPTHAIKESYTHINITQKISTFKHPTQHAHNLKREWPSWLVYNFYRHPHSAHKNHTWIFF
jgi:hypothetical protein